MKLKETVYAGYYCINFVILTSIDMVSFLVASFWRNFPRGDILFRCLLFQEPLWIHTLFFSGGALGFCNSGKYFLRLTIYTTLNILTPSTWLCYETIVANLGTQRNVKSYFIMFIILVLSFENLYIGS